MTIKNELEMLLGHTFFSHNESRAMFESHEENNSQNSQLTEGEPSDDFPEVITNTNTNREQYKYKENKPSSQSEDDEERKKSSQDS